MAEREFWPLESRFDIGKVTKATLEAFKARPEVPLQQDRSKVTWESLGKLAAGLRKLTEQVRQQADALSAECYYPYLGLSQAAIAAIFPLLPLAPALATWMAANEIQRCRWQKADRDAFYRDLVDWEESLASYEQLISQGVGDPWELVGERMLAGVFRWTDDQGNPRVLDSYPDFATAFIVANQLVVQEQLARQWWDNWVAMLEEISAGISGVVGDVVETAAGAAGAVVGAYKAGQRLSGLLLFGAGVAVMFMLAKGRR
jgi:hypothetical protein